LRFLLNSCIGRAVDRVAFSPPNGQDQYDYLLFDNLVHEANALLTQLNPESVKK